MLPGLKVAAEAPGTAVPKQEWGAGTEELSPHDLSLIREEIFSKKPPADLPCDWSWSPLDQPQANGCENVLTNIGQSPCSLSDCTFEPQ